MTRILGFCVAMFLVSIGLVALSGSAEAASGGGCRTTSAYTACVGHTSDGRATAEGDFHITINGSCTEYVDLYKNGKVYKYDTENLCLSNGSITFDSSANQHGSFYVKAGFSPHCSTPCSYPGPTTSPTLTL